MCAHVLLLFPQDTDTAGQKLGGALLNAIIFMAVIAGMTFILFLLFKWGVSHNSSSSSGGGGGHQGTSTSSNGGV